MTNTEELSKRLDAVNDLARWAEREGRIDALLAAELACIASMGRQQEQQRASHAPRAPARTWVELFIEPAHTVTRHDDVERLYVKARCLCVQTSERDASGDPKIHHYWLGEGGVIHYVTAHRPHSGTTQQLDRR
jgi:hypothetical protein